ncbi:hypothetical protein [Motilibacter rhizosphaerae]|uniref:hypothetical protein n=1 Tax=Motilibacter rhizosphaerae TaxID=598652 RepID=UPI001E3F30B3|nr:hypothetical protein [Motilibacter rhizosphaerae]
MSAPVPPRRPTHPRPPAEAVRGTARAFVAAIERHLLVVEHRSGEADPKVAAAFNDLRTAFLDYEDAVYEAYDEVLPFEVLEDEDDIDLDDDDEDDELDDDELEEIDDEDDED